MGERSDAPRLLALYQSSFSKPPVAVQLPQPDVSANRDAPHIATRLARIAYQHEQSSEPHGPSPLLRAYKPLAAAIEAVPDLKSLWRAKSTEDIQIALDKAQSANWKH